MSDPFAAKAKELLASCIDGSGTPEQHKELEHTFSKAINSQPCPCGSKSTFGECCKMSWNLFLRMQKRTKEAVKENNKDVRKENDQGKQEEKDVQWMLQIGVGKNGDLAIKQLQSPGIPISQAAKILLGAYYEMNIAGTNQAISSAIHSLVNQMTGKQGPTGIIRP